MDFYILPPEFFLLHFTLWILWFITFYNLESSVDWHVFDILDVYQLFSFGVGQDDSVTNYKI